MSSHSTTRKTDMWCLSRMVAVARPGGERAAVRRVHLDTDPPETRHPTVERDVTNRVGVANVTGDLLEDRVDLGGRLRLERKSAGRVSELREGFRVGVEVG